MPRLPPAIIVIDDDPAFLAIAETQLTGAGYHVMLANTGAQATTLIK